MLTELQHAVYVAPETSYFFYARGDWRKAYADNHDLKVSMYRGHPLLNGAVKISALENYNKINQIDDVVLCAHYRLGDFTGDRSTSVPLTGLKLLGSFLAQIEAFAAANSVTKVLLLTDGDMEQVSFLKRASKYPIVYGCTLPDDRFQALYMLKIESFP
jgi:hypothetical protein